MAKIFEGIEGYADLSIEEKLKALESIENFDANGEIDRLKKTASKACSEAADYKRKLSEKMTESEKAQAEKDEELETLRNLVKESQRKEIIASHKAKYSALGYDEELASRTAEAMADGNTEEVFASMKTFLSNHDKAYKDSLMRAGSEPPAGETNTARTFSSEEIKGMSASEINANWDAIKNSINK